MDRREFARSLDAYYTDKGKSPPPPEPELAGKPVSLYHLFERVTKLGGSHVLSLEDKWQDILQAFNLTPPSATLAYGLRKIYKQYLESFERLQLYGEEPRDDEEDETPSRGALDFLSEPRRNREDSYSQSYDRHVRRRMFDNAGSSYDPNFQSMYKPDPPEWRIINSLHSCLPNEVNFILNTLLLYCSDHGRKRLRLERCPHLLDALMLHAGCPADHDIDLCFQWQQNSKLYMSHYWNERLNNHDDLKPLLGIFPDMPNAIKSTDGFLSGEKDREGQRIRQILVIIRNICQDLIDTHIIRRSEKVWCFLLRCALSSEDTGLTEQALETLSILLTSDKTDRSMQMPVWIDEPYKSLVLEMVTRLMRKSDKLIQIRVLEIYTSLLEQTVYESTEADEEEVQTIETLQEKAKMLLEYLPDLSELIIPNLTLPDCDLLVATLEALAAIARSPLAMSMVKPENIGVLVDLLSFTSRNYDFSKLRFYGPRHGETTHFPLVVTPRLPRRVASQAPGHPPPGVNPSSPAKPALRLQEQVQMIKPQTPQKARLPIAPAPNNLKDDQSQIQTTSANFARNFIQKRIELGDENELLSRQGVFVEYTTKAQQEIKIAGVGGTPVLTVSEFTRLVREIFPTTQVLNDSHNRQSFVGIRIKTIKKESEPVSTPPAEAIPSPVANGHSPVANGGSAVHGDIAHPPGIIPNGVANGISASEGDEDSNHSLDSVGGGMARSRAKIEPKLETVPEKPSITPERERETDLENTSKRKIIDENSTNSHSDKEYEDRDQESPTNGPANGKLVPKKRSTEEEAKSEPVPPKRAMVQQQTAPAGLRVLLQNAGHYLFDDFTDDREDCLTRAVRIHAATILLSLAEQSVSHGEEDIVPMIRRFEERISLMAASRQDASPVLARLLAFIP